MSETWLSPEEVKELTGRVRHPAQCRKLAEMKIPFRPNAIGRPLVERTMVLSSPVPAAAKRKTGPNWDALHGKAA